MRILLSASAHKAPTLSETTKSSYVLVNIAGVQQAFGVEINYAAFLMPPTTEIITIGFNFFCFVPSTHFALALLLIKTSRYGIASRLKF